MYITAIWSFMYRSTIRFILSFSNKTYILILLTPSMSTENYHKRREKERKKERKKEAPKAWVDSSCLKENTTSLVAYNTQS